MPVKKGKLSAEQFVKMLKELKSKSSAFDFAALENSKELSSLIVIKGTERLRVRRLVQWVQETLFAEDKESCAKYFGSSLTTKASVQGIVSTLENPPLFSRAGMIVVYDVDKIKTASKNLLVDAIKSQKSPTLVLLTSGEANKKNAILSGLLSSATVVEIEELKGNKLLRWVEREIKAKGNEQEIDREALALLAENCGADISLLTQEIQRLCLLTNRQEKITLGLVEEFLRKTSKQTSFLLLQHIAKKKTSSAVAAAEELLAQGLAPLQLNSFLSRAFRTMILAKKQSSHLPQSLANPWFLRNLRGSTNAFSSKELKDSLDIVKSLDAQLKSSSLPPQLLVSIAISRLSLRKKALVYSDY